MSGIGPTRSAVIELKDERRAMHEGYVFLDEKCLLLAGEILRQLARQATLRRSLDAAHAAAVVALPAAVARHGLHGLQVAPAPGALPGRLQVQPGTLMGVKLQEVVLAPGTAEAEAEAAAAVEASPELEACRRAFAALAAAAVPLAAVEGNLERLSAEYRRAVRRARALQDVMLPELDGSIRDVEGRLEELEQEEVVFLRAGARPRD